MKDKKKFFVSLFCIMITAFFLSIIVTDEFSTKNDYDFTIEFLQEPNAKSNYNSVWFKGFIVDNKLLQPNMFEIPTGWTEYAGFWHVYGFANEKEKFQAHFSNVDGVEMKLYVGPDEGRIKISDQTSEKIVDLYSETGMDIVYKVDIGKSVHQRNTQEIFLVYIVSVIVLLILLYGIYKSRKVILFWQVILYGILYFLSPIMSYSNETKCIMFIITIVSTYLFIKAVNSIEMKQYWTRKSLVAIVGVCLYIGFATIGEPLILKPTTVELSIEAVCYWSVISIYVFPIVIAFIYMCEYLTKKLTLSIDANKRKTHFYGLFFTMFGVCTLWLIANYPGNMPGDTINIWQIVNGDSAYWSGHPFYYYLSIKLLLMMINSPVFVVMVQYAFFCLINAEILSYLETKGLRYKVCLLIGILMMLIPSNGIGQVTILKDYPHATALLWLTFLILKLIWEKEKFINKRNIFELIVALLLTVLYRPNGIFAFYATGICILYISKNYVKRAKRILRMTVALSIIIKITLNTMIPYLTPNGSQLSDVTSSAAANMICDNLAGVAASGKSLSADTTKFMEQYMSMEEWREFYEPYNSPPYAPDSIKTVANDNSVADLCPYLFDSIVKAPEITIKTRLNKLNVLWDITPIKGDQFYMHLCVGENQYGLYRHHNVLSDLLFSRVTANKSDITVVYVLFYNIGICIILLMLIAINIAKHHKQLLYMYIPVTMNALSLVISCRWQDFRYYYFILPISIYVFIFSIIFLRNKEKEITEKIKERIHENTISKFTI